MIPLIAWLAAAALLLSWSLSQTIHIGQMVLPRSQVAALALSIIAAVGLALCWASLLFRAISRRMKRPVAPSILDRRSVRYPLVALLLLFPLLFVYGRYIEPRWVATRTIQLGVPPASGLAPVRVAVISDLHVDGEREPFTSLAGHVNAAEPDVILLLGDTLNHPGALPSLRRVLRRMKARRGKYAVYGNWETWYWNRLPLLRGTGFSWLHRRRRTLKIRGQTLHLAGLPFSNDARGSSGERLLSPVKGRPGWRIFCYHTPDLIMQVPSADLYVAGHTHGGQVSIPFFGALITLSKFGKRFERGMYRVGSTRLYVNPGVGVEPMIPIRLGVRPEVTLFVLGEKPRRSR